MFKKLNQKGVNLSDFKVYVTKMGGEPSIKTTNKKPEGKFVTLKATDDGWVEEPTYEGVEIGEEITIRKYGKVITIYQDHTDTTKIHIREDPDV